MSTTPTSTSRNEIAHDFTKYFRGMVTSPFLDDEKFAFATLETFVDGLATVNLLLSQHGLGVALHRLLVCYLRNTKDNASQQADTLKHVENLIKAIEISTTHYNDVSVVSQWFERASNADFNFPINDND